MIDVTLYTDPACPFAFSAEPARLRLRWHYGDGLLDDPSLIAGAARDAGLHPQQLRAWSEEPATDEALAQDIADSRRPSAAARALDHKLGGPRDERYTAPSYELATAHASVCLPGFNPVEAYEAAIANLDPGLTRRAPPETVVELGVGRRSAGHRRDRSDHAAARGRGAGAAGPKRPRHPGRRRHVLDPFGTA